MITSVLYGLVAASMVAAITYFQSAYAPESKEALHYSPLVIIGISAIALLLQRFILDRRPGGKAYDGLADLLIHIHSPASPDSVFRWVARGFVSFLLAVFAVFTGPEGAAIEVTHAFAMQFRPRSARWFEQRRRTDAASSLAAGISAAFGAPFTGVLLPIELGFGGRIVTAVLASIVAFVASRYFADFAGFPRFETNGLLYGFTFLGMREWGGAIAIGLLTGLMGSGVVWFVRYTQESLQDLFRSHTWLRIVLSGMVLFLLGAIYGMPFSPQVWLEHVLWAHRSYSEIPVLCGVLLLGISVVASGFGTLGIFWPMYLLGGVFGFGINYWCLREIPGFAAPAGLIGASALWGAVFGAPISGAVLTYELTQNLQLVVPALVAGLIAREVRQRLRMRSLLDRDLEARGVALVEGRASSVLDSVLVREAMVTDHATVQEQDPVAEIYAKLVQSRYAFLPVVNAQGRYVGLLTADMIQEAWRAQEKATSNSPLAQLLEAKDLIYRAGLKVPTVHDVDRLSIVSGVFEDLPCVPVMGEGNSVVGLLFSYAVRVAYDREVVRRSLTLDKP